MRRLYSSVAGLVIVVAVAAAIPARAVAAPPPNDSFAAAQALSGQPGTQTGTTKEATKEAGEPQHAGNAGGASVWYRWKAEADGTLFLGTWEVGAATFDTLLAVYTGAAVDALTEIASNDDVADDGTVSKGSAVKVSVVAGAEYVIAVDGYNGETGPFRLTWSHVPPPPANDDFEDAQTIQGKEGTVRGSDVSATSEPDGPEGSGSIWYRWTAPATMHVRFHAHSNHDPVLGVYTGTRVDALRTIAFNDDFLSLASGLSFRATAGVTYSIAAFNLDEGGDITLRWYPGAIIYGTSRADTITGTPGRDYITGENGGDALSGLAGGDFIVGGAGADIIRGGAGDDRLDGRDRIRANDVIRGGPGTDRAVGDRGDRIYGVP